MTADITQFSGDTIRRIAESLRRTQYAPINSPRPAAHQFAKSGPRTVRRARTATNEEHPDYPDAPANCYVVELGEMVPDGEPEPGQVPFDFEPYDPPQYRLAFVCDDAACNAAHLPEGTLVHIALHHGLWWIQQPGESDRVELCLAEDHPGPDIQFDAYLGTWSPEHDKWCYDDAPLVKAIDHRHGPANIYPDAGARGIFFPMPSTNTDSGILYVLLTLDCISPGPCPTCAEYGQLLTLSISSTQWPFEVIVGDYDLWRADHPDLPEDIEAWYLAHFSGKARHKIWISEPIECEEEDAPPTRAIMESKPSLYEMVFVHADKDEYAEENAGLIWFHPFNESGRTAREAIVESDPQRLIFNDIRLLLTPFGEDQFFATLGCGELFEMDDDNPDQEMFSVVVTSAD